MAEIHEKWGFGMAPYKRHTEDQRVKAALEVLEVLAAPSVAAASEASASISEVKGLYNRSHRQDQWDWFTTWYRLGRPSRPRARSIAEGLKSLRTIAKDSSTEDSIYSVVERLQLLGTVSSLRGFVANEPPPAELGQVYILSTRESRDILKIGYTNRDVRKRVSEINRATGVLVPFGVRAVWVVRHAQKVESALHELFAEYRVRVDREFFRIDFKDAFGLISEYLRTERLENADL
ncbi:MAG: hypothetical protein AUK47_24670 [Deltaproteobacteria bacterium CG2_30_63_29]|nr:MAG: hypothetical protein AUK47_24670 [Deltaproteobacteria bacterium CG2_30_63_29]